MQTILVATDLSERSDKALRQAAHLAVAHGASLHVLYVVDDEIPTRIAKEITSAAKETLNEKLAQRPTGQPAKTTIHVAFMPVWKGIVDAVEALQADMLVMGPHRSRGIMELFRGTTVERVVKMTKAPLLVVNNPAPAHYHDVIVGVDFSDCARNAIKTGATLAPEASMTLVNAYHLPFKQLTQRADSDGSIEKRDRLAVESKLAEDMKVFLERVDNKTLRAKSAFIEGGAAPVLIEEARRRKSDLICVGSHGRSWLAEAFLGSTARAMLSAAPCDVLVVPL